MLYLLDAPVIITYGNYRFQGPLEQADAGGRITGDFISAISHESTAALLSKLFRRIVPVNPIQILMNPGDTALVFRLNGRLPEGMALTSANLASLDYEFGWLERTS